MFLPKFLYEILPYLYLIVGGLAMWMPVTYGRVSGFMLCFTAALILHLRRSYRSLK